MKIVFFQVLDACDYLRWLEHGVNNTNVVGLIPVWILKATNSENRSVQETTGCGSQCYGLVGIVVFGERLD